MALSDSLDKSIKGTRGFRSRLVVTLDYSCQLRKIAIHRAKKKGSSVGADEPVWV